MENNVMMLYNELLQKHGKPRGQWSLWCKRSKTAEEKEAVIVEAILTQRTNWKNVEMAMKNLCAAKITRFCEIHKKGAQSIAPLIRPSGFYAQKSEYLFALSQFILKKYGTVEKMQNAPLKELREELLLQKGVGPETADSILLYALEKPVFVIDEYTRRISKARGISEDKNYARLQEIFEARIRKDCALYQDFHALIVIEGKEKQNIKSIQPG